MALKQRETATQKLTCMNITYSNNEEIGRQSIPFVDPSQSFEIITSGEGRNRFNDCIHIKRKFLRTDNSLVTVKYKGSGLSGTYQPNGYAYPVPNEALPGVPPKNGIDQFILRGVANIKPSFKAELSVPNFLFELKDLKKLVPDRRAIADLAASLRAWTGSHLRQKTKYRSLTEFHNAFASQHLNARFGYLPLIDDAFKLKTAFESFNQRLKTFVNASKKPQTGHYKEVVDGSVRPEVVYYTADGFYLSYIDEVFPVTYTLTLRYGFNILLPVMRVPYLFEKYLGFRNNPRILWDAIPFSFLVDWFVRVGNALESFDEGAVPLQMSILDACISTKYRVQRVYYARNVDSPTLEWDFPGRTGQANYEVYTRRRIELSSISLSGLPPLPTLDGLSTSEVALGASLGKVLTHQRSSNR